MDVKLSGNIFNYWSQYIQFRRTWKLLSWGANLDKVIGFDLLPDVWQFFFPSPLCPDKCHALRFLFPCSGFKCGAAYVANLHLKLFPLLTPVGLSFGVFRQNWHNWISAQILYLDSFGDVINLTAAIGNLCFDYCYRTCNVSIAFSFVVCHWIGVIKMSRIRHHQICTRHEREKISVENLRR